jgi:hypothetical protein
MARTFEGLEGVSLAGAYRLEQWLGGDQSGAFFLTSFEPRGDRAVLKVVPDNPATGEAQLAIWREIRRFTHPNLLRLFDCGRAVDAGDSLLYAVFEYPDDSLDAALRTGGLSPGEKRDVLTAVTNALRYIHSQGLMHTAVDASHIVAVGDRIKLTTDCLRPAGEHARPEDEIDALYQLLGTPREPESTRPLSALSPGPAVRHRMPRWSFAVVGAAVAMLGLALFHSPSRPAAPAAAADRVATPLAALKADPEPVERPASVVPSTAVSTPAAAPRPRTEWRVIAYTYSRLRDAEHKAETINRKIPGLQAEVFAPKGKNQPPYMVALGGRMTRDEAAALQRRARSKGLPRDTFIRNYSD